MPQQLPLRDIILPMEIGLWPPAIGWWLLAIIIPLALYGCWRAYKRLTRQTIIKTAKNKLSDISQTHISDLQTLQALSNWLRRVAMSINGREACAGLTGEDWLVFLDKSVDGSPFSNGVGRCLVDSLYAPTSTKNIDIKGLSELCEHWLKGQKI